MCKVNAKPPLLHASMHASLRGQTKRLCFILCLLTSKRFSDHYEPNLNIYFSYTCSAIETSGLNCRQQWMSTIRCNSHTKCALLQIYTPAAEMWSVSVAAPWTGWAATDAITPFTHHLALNSSTSSSGLRPLNQLAGTPAVYLMSVFTRRQSRLTCCCSVLTNLDTTAWDVCAEGPALLHLAAHMLRNISRRK